MTGPAQGGRHGRPFFSAFHNLGSFGYTEEEYFVSGEAVRYEPVGDHAGMSYHRLPLVWP